MKIDNTSTQLLFTTVPIASKNMDDETISTGTAFILNASKNNGNVPILVTNSHVIKDASKLFMQFFLKENEVIAKRKFTVEIDSHIFNSYQDETLDIALIPLAPILQQLPYNKLFYRSIPADLVCTNKQAEKLSAIEDVIFIGYPYGLQENTNRFPIVRKGITATPVWSNHGNSTFLIDAGIFPGSSGSPVFIANQGAYANGANISIGSRLIFLGMIKSSIVAPQGNQFIGLGEVIKAESILDHAIKNFDLNG